jgi:hypothetical protein
MLAAMWLAPTVVIALVVIYALLRGRGSSAAQVVQPSLRFPRLQSETTGIPAAPIDDYGRRPRVATRPGGERLARGSEPPPNTNERIKLVTMRPTLRDRLRVITPARFDGLWDLSDHDK